MRISSPPFVPAKAGTQRWIAKLNAFDLEALRWTPACAGVSGWGMLQTRVIARVLDVGPGQALVELQFRRFRPNPRARGTPRALKDPRTSMPRDIEACRSPSRL